MFMEVKDGYGTIGYTILGLAALYSILRNGDWHFAKRS